MTDIFETARWVVDGRLTPWAVSDESVAEMARKLLEAVDACERMADALAEAGEDKRVAVEREREACAMVCEEVARDRARLGGRWSTFALGSAAGDCSTLIRARGRK